MAIEEIYREKILQHYRNPQHFGELHQSNAQSWEQENPLCGDHIRLMLHIDNHKIQDIAFQGAGCALCIASASMMCHLIHGLPVSEAAKILYDVLEAFQGESEILAAYGDLAAFQGVIPFPNRAKCVLLAWQTLELAIAEHHSIEETDTLNN